MPFRRPFSSLIWSRHASILSQIQHSSRFQINTLSHTRRHISLGSIFPRWASEPALQPATIAQMTQLEAEADINRRDVDKQLALFRGIFSTDRKKSFELIISRWEQMCLHDPSSPLLHSDEAFRIYITCLAKTGQQSAMEAAAGTRDALIKAHPLPASTTNESTETVEPSLPSQKIVQEVASGAGVTGQALPNETSTNPAVNSLLSQPPNVPIKVTLVDSSPWLPKLLRVFAVTFLVALFGLAFLSMLLENSGIVKTNPKVAQFEAQDGKVVHFSDVQGVDEAKDELEDIVQFLRDPSSFTALGGKLPKGVLLTGPPGTGKTLLARAVAGEAGVPFFFTSGSDFEEMFVGVGAKRVRDLFAMARKKQPAIIFIDELDAVGGKRNGRDQQYMKQTLNQLLVELDGFQQTDGVIVIAATNFPQSLDQALVRPGRFDREIAVPLPDVRGRAQILAHHMKGVTIAKDVDTKVLARGTPGFSGADLQNLINLAAIQASKEKSKAVEHKHLEWAKDRIVMGAERKSQFIPEKDKLATAYHEGGHTLVTLYTEGATPLHKVTCLPRGHSLGHTAMLPEADKYSRSYKEYRASIDVSMGGRVAEELIYGTENITSGASSDIQQATSVARAMVKNWGFSKLGPVYYDNRDDILSPHMLEEIEGEVTRLIKEGETRATELLTSKLEELHRLAHALLEHETLDADEVRKVIKGEKIRGITQKIEEDLSTMANTTAAKNE